MFLNRTDLCLAPISSLRQSDKAKAIRTPVSSFLTMISIVLLVGVMQGTGRDGDGGTHDSENLGTTPRLPAVPLMPLLTRHY